MFSCQLKRDSQLKQRSGVQNNGARHAVEIFLAVAGLRSDLICLPLHGFTPIGQSSSPLRDCETQTPDHYGAYPFDIHVAPTVHRLSRQIHVLYRSWHPLTAPQLLYAELSDAANRYRHVDYRASVLRCDTDISVAQSPKIHPSRLRPHRGALFFFVSLACTAYPRQVTTLANVPWASQPVHLRTHNFVANALRSCRHHDNA